MKYFAIAEKRKTDALKVLGVDGIAAETSSDVRKAVSDALSEKSIGTLLVSEDVYKAAEDIISEHREKGILPVVMLLDD